MWHSQYSPSLHRFTYQANSMHSVSHRAGLNISHFSAGLQGLFLLILLPSDTRESLSLSFPVLPLMAKSMGQQRERQTPPLLVLLIMGVLETERGAEHVCTCSDRRVFAFFCNHMAMPLAKHIFVLFWFCLVAFFFFFF